VIPALLCISRARVFPALSALRAQVFSVLFRITEVRAFPAFSAPRARAFPALLRITVNARIYRTRIQNRASRRVLESAHPPIITHHKARRPVVNHGPSLRVTSQHTRRVPTNHTKISYPVIERHARSCAEYHKVISRL